MIRASVVLCTFKRYDLARNCLSYLDRQSMPRDEYEIVVVDNTPTELRMDMVWDEYHVDKVVVEETPGLSRARNAGIAASQAEIVVFIDDDAEADKEWLNALTAAFDKQSDAKVIGGGVRAKYLGKCPPWMSKRTEGYLSCIDWGEGISKLKAGQWIAGANMAFRRSVFEEHGLFNVSLGRIGHGTLLSNEEIAYIQVLGEGVVYYCGDAVVDHLIPPERTEQSWFRKRVYWQAVSDLLAGQGSAADGARWFEDFLASCVKAPAEYRSFKALNYACESADEFEEQLHRIYFLIFAAGIGLPTIGETDLEI